MTERGREKQGQWGTKKEIVGDRIASAISSREEKKKKRKEKKPMVTPWLLKKKQLRRERF